MTVGVDLAVTTTSLLLSILDVEQQIMTGSPHLNSFSGQTSKIIRWPGLSYHWSGYYYYCRKKKGEEEEREGGVYRNPLIASNCPDPAVVRLLDGSGYALVASSDQATKSDNSSVFPVYFSTGHQPPVSPSFLITFLPHISRPGQLEPGEPHLQPGQPAQLVPGPILRPGAPHRGGQIPPLLHCRGQPGKTQLWRRSRLL